MPMMMPVALVAMVALPVDMVADMVVVTMEGMQEVLEADFMAGGIKPRMKGKI